MRLERNGLVHKAFRRYQWRNGRSCGTSPPHVLDFQGLQGDFDFQSINRSTMLTLPLRPGDQAAILANVHTGFGDGVPPGCRGIKITPRECKPRSVSAHSGYASAAGQSAESNSDFRRAFPHSVGPKTTK